MKGFHIWAFSEKRSWATDAAPSIWGGWRICYYKRNANRKDRFRNCDISPLASIDGAAEIGEYTYVGKDVDITKAKIGRYCGIGSHVRIGQGEHNME